MKNSFIGFDSRTYQGNTEIAPHDATYVTARPQIPFRGTRLAVWSTIAPAFLIHSFEVGTFCIGASSSTVPADAFATKLDMLPLLDAALAEHGIVKIECNSALVDAIGLPLAMPVCFPGQEIRLHIENTTDAPSRFVAILLGDEDRLAERPRWS